MEIKKFIVLSNFFQPMSAVFLFFVFAATMGDATTEIVIKYNDKNTEKTLLDYLIFWVGTIIFAAVWSLIWVWFKKSEKVCVDYWNSLKNK